MNIVEQISLVSIEYAQDDLGEWTETRKDNYVFAMIESVSASEFYNASLQGLKAEYRAVIWIVEYHGEELVEMFGKIYNVYRTYRRDDGRIELYLNEKKGDEDDA